MFAINSADLPSIYDYRSALDYYNSIEPLRGSANTLERPIGRRTSSNPKKVVKLGDDSIAFKLHATYCVIYHSDNYKISVTTYPSRSTVAFINALTPNTVSFGGEDCDELHLRRGPDGSCEDGGYVCKLRGSFVDLVWDDKTSERSFVKVADESQLQPYRHYRVDRKLANAAYKEHNIQSFVDFFAAYASMQNWQPQHYGRRTLSYTMYSKLSEDLRQSAWWPDVLRDLRNGNRSKWANYATRMAFSISIDPAAVRKAIMDVIKIDCDCIVFDEHMYVQVQSFPALKNSQRLDEGTCRSFV